jgi:SAM-dependent methyltransferase
MAKTKQTKKINNKKLKIDFPTPFNLDVACGQNKTPGFFGVDIAKAVGVDLVWDLENFPWPIPDNSVDQIVCNHYIEHTKDIIKFMEEIYRILKPGRTALIRAPYYNSVRAWQDPTHTRVISEATFLYYNRDWMIANKLDHYDIKADFDYSFGYDFMPDWIMRSEEAKAFAVRHYTNVVSDIQVLLTKKIDTTLDLKK